MDITELRYKSRQSSADPCRRIKSLVSIIASPSVQNLINISMGNQFSFLLCEIHLVQNNIQPQYVFRLPLKGRTQEDVFQAFCAKTRYNIGLSLRKGVTVREYSGDDRIPEFILENFYTLMQTTGKRDHFYIRGLEYFRGLMNALQNDAKIYLAYLQGQPIAGAIEVFCGNKAWYLYGASANEHRNVMPNYLLQWIMIQEAMERGCDFYDFRGVPGNVSEDDPLYGLYRFKKGFSGTYTKFTGLFTCNFRPLLCKVLQVGIQLRQATRSETRKK